MIPKIQESQQVDKINFYYLILASFFFILIKSDSSIFLRNTPNL